MHRVCTFNVLASDFTDFSIGVYKQKETKQNMFFRYNDICKILKWTSSDIICLQEVDQILYTMLSKSFSKQYSMYYTLMRKGEATIGYGLLCMIDKKLSQIDYEKSYDLDISPMPLLHELNRNNSRKAQFVHLKNGEIIANTHLTGIPERTDIRVQELTNILKESPSILCGDFNEPDYKVVKKLLKVYSMEFYEDYFKLDSSEFASSLHKYIIDEKKGNEFILKPISEWYKTIDYICFLKKEFTLKKNACSLILPNAEHGIFGIDPIIDKSWPSDHTFLQINLMRKQNVNNL